jgi:YggT family protein
VNAVIDLVRYSVFGLFMLALAAAVASWLVRTRKVSPFTPLGRALKTASDPLITPVERRVVRRGGNPIHAGMWLVVLVAVAGLLLLGLLRWSTSFVQQAYWAFNGGAKPLFHFFVNVTYSVLLIALLARVIGSWFGVFEHSKWVRPAYWLTDWIVNPIRKFLPPVGALDVSPIAAWLALWILKAFLLTVVPI